MSDYRAEKDGSAMVTLRGVTKTFERGGEKLQILSGLDLDIAEGSFEALMGPSGSGKSTLLNIVAGLDRPSAGSVVVKGEDIAKLSESALAGWRSRTLGFIFQSYNLMPVLTAVENVELPLLLTNLSSSERKKRAEIALRVVGLEGRMGHYPSQLSGGQEQRVAIARGVLLLMLALVFGKSVQDGPLAEYFRLSKTTLTLLIAGYGFVASVLPVWMLLCPRDYLSSYLKIGTIALLVVGIIVVNPRLEMPALQRPVNAASGYARSMTGAAEAFDPGMDEATIEQVLARVLARRARGELPPEPQSLPLAKEAFPKLLCLDLNKWVALSRAQLGHADAAGWLPALASIRAATRAGRLVVPILGVNADEATAAGDRAQRRRLVEFMVDLSGNQSMANEVAVAVWAMKATIPSMLGAPEPPRSPRPHLVHRGVAAAVAGQIFEARGVHPGVGALLAEVHMEPELAVAALVSWMPRGLLRDLRARDEAAAVAVRRIRANDAHLSLAQRRALEVPNLIREGGLAELLRQAIQESGLPPQPFFDWLADDQQALRFGSAVPWIDVYSTLMLTRDRNRDAPTHVNDGKDLAFLSAAIPYANVVVAEKGWSHLANSTGLSEKYHTQVVANLGLLPSILAQEGCIPPISG